MKDRILAFLHSENKSYAQFAEEIGVQPSGISHILSGRNNPSLDFVMKMLQKYTSLSAEWLLFGRGAMYKYVSQPTLFDSEPVIKTQDQVPVDLGTDVGADVIDGLESPKTTEASNIVSEITPERGERKLNRVLLFYSDKTFNEYRPG